MTAETYLVTSKGKHHIVLAPHGYERVLEGKTKAGDKLLYIKEALARDNYSYQDVDKGGEMISSNMLVLRKK